MVFSFIFHLFPRVTQLCAIKLTKGEISTFPVSSPTCDAIRFSQFKVKRERAVALNTNPSQQSSELSFRRVTCTCTSPRGSHKCWGRWIFYDILVRRYTRIMRFPKPTALIGSQLQDRIATVDGTRASLPTRRPCAAVFSLLGVFRTFS